MEIGNLLFGHSRGQYSVPREWQNTFVEFLESIGCDGYGFFYPQKDLYAWQNSRGGITNDTFEILPYYWGEDEEEMIRPNFKYFVNTYELKWYKYPLRDSYSNFILTYEQFCEMLDNCRRSVLGNDRI